MLMSLQRNIRSTGASRVRPAGVAVPAMSLIEHLHHPRRGAHTTTGNTVGEMTRRSGGTRTVENDVTITAIPLSMHMPQVTTATSPLQKTGERGGMTCLLREAIETDAMDIMTMGITDRTRRNGTVIAIITDHLEAAWIATVPVPGHRPLAPRPARMVGGVAPQRGPRVAPAPDRDPDPARAADTTTARDSLEEKSYGPLPRGYLTTIILRI